MKLTHFTAVRRQNNPVGILLACGFVKRKDVDNQEDIVMGAIPLSPLRALDFDNRKERKCGKSPINH